MSRFEEQAKQIKENAKYAPLNILVWGPGNPGPDASPEKQKAYQKRIEIKEVLRKEFSRAEVHFSEDPEMIRITDGIHGQLRKEALQARVADLIIMLDISRGADLELDHFVPTYPWFRDKVHVFLPMAYVSPKGLVREVFDHIRPDQVQGFTKQEFEDCSIATLQAVQVAHTIALASYLS